MVTRRGDVRHMGNPDRGAGVTDVRCVTRSCAAPYVPDFPPHPKLRPEPADVKPTTPSRTSTRFRAMSLALAVIAVLAAGVLPVCGGMCCPVSGTVTNIHAQMPCCAGATSFARGDSLRLPPASFAGLSSPPQMWVPVAVVERSGASLQSPPRVQATLTTASAARHEPHPPLFLLNAQFLI